MANPNTPFGLAPVRYLNGAPWNGQARMYCIPTSDDTNTYAIGDPVVLAGSADANGIPTITRWTAGAGVLGAIAGYGGSVYGGPGAIPGALETTLIPATKAQAYYVMVVDDPWVVFEIQEIGTGTPFTAAEVGLNCNMVYAAGNGYLSGVVLNNVGEDTTSTLDVKLLSLSQRKTNPQNTFGAYAKWEVLINNHAFKVGTAGF